VKFDFIKFHRHNPFLKYELAAYTLSPMPMHQRVDIRHSS
jgi:hypothetical protein